MIVDIENKGEYLKVSTFSEEGDLIFVDVPVPEDQRFIWEKVRPGDRKADAEWKTWEIGRAHV